VAETPPLLPAKPDLLMQLMPLKRLKRPKQPRLPKPVVLNLSETALAMSSKMVRAIQL
jgi:hypothetical protein